MIKTLVTYKKEQVEECIGVLNQINVTGINAMGNVYNSVLIMNNPMRADEEKETLTYNAEDINKVIIGIDTMELKGIENISAALHVFDVLKNGGDVTDEDAEEAQTQVPEETEKDEGVERVEAEDVEVES